MKIMNLTENSKIYTSSVYLVLGTWNTVYDINTLIDAGSDESIIDKLEHTNTGLGKKKINHLILTHSHSDHVALLPRIKEKFDPKVFAFNAYIKGVNQVLKDGEMVHIGDQYFEVFHITAHSSDSICLYGEKEGILFTGDTTFPLEFDNETLEKENEAVINRLSEKQVNIVYPGHGPPRLFNNKPFRVI